jgi:hypothetical protein
MKKTKLFISYVLLLGVFVLNTSIVLSKPEEGMFPPDRISKLDLNKKGLKIKPSDLYNPNGVDISDAVVRLSIGCSGAFVSPKGLILTNHHCVFDALVSASSPGKDYGKEGFRAGSMVEEIPAQNYSIFITNRVEDVTSKVLAGTENLKGEQLEKAIDENVQRLVKAEQEKAPKGAIVRIQAVNSGLFYYLYETFEIKDIRLVYAPPQNIGYFGGDPDNFEWTRHAGDFAFLRAYVAPDGTSASYSPNNVPYQPKKHLTISLDGIKENDFVFVMGYPGSTTRYRESQSIQYSQEVNFPFIVNYLKAWVNGLYKAGEESEEKRIKLQSDIFSLNNSIKAYEGGINTLRRANVVAKRRAEEEKLASWINADPNRKAKYGMVLEELQKVSEEYYRTAARDRILRTIPNPNSTPIFSLIVDAINAVSQGKKLQDSEKMAIKAVFSSHEPLVEEEVIKFYLKAIDELPANQKFQPAEKIFGQSSGKKRSMEEAEFAEIIIKGDEFNSPEKIFALYEKSLDELKQKYPKIVEFVLGLLQERNEIRERTAKFSKKIDSLRVLYQKAMAEMKSIEPYPDANSTLRFTYGYIKGYEPREAVIYKPFTTLKGMIEKDTGIPPFDIPAKLKELQAKKDFGRFGVGDSVPLNFLATTDIIGGNSGSPIMNAEGEQIGIIFDGNYEGLGNDIYYDLAYNRAIAVDIRFVLFVTEKFADAGWILQELTIKESKKARTAQNKGK